MSTTSSHRLGAEAAVSARIDRTRELTFTVDGKSFTGFAGDTVASAMLGAGIRACGDSLYLKRPRGIVSAGVEESNALVKVGARWAGHVNESMLPATTVELTDGMDVTLLQGLGQLDPRADEAVYDRKHVHTDVLIVGAGPAGLAAAREAAKSGARVILIDEQPEAGGSLLSASTETIDGKPAAQWIAETRAALAAAPRSSPTSPAAPRSAATTPTTSSPSSAAPTTWPASWAPGFPASASGTSVRPRSCWPPARTNARWSSRTTTARASCWPPPPAPT